MEKRLVGRRSFVTLGLGSVACAAFAPRGRIKMKYKGPGDKKAKVIYDKKFRGWGEMFDAMNGAAEVAGETAGKMVATLTEVPPPGHVKLGDLSPGLSAHADSKADFVASASKEEPEKFRYVQIGVPGFDKFFKASAELYAYVFQTRETLVTLHEHVGSGFEVGSEGTASLSAKVDSALESASDSAKAELEVFKGVAVELSGAASGFVERVADLVTAGEMLVADAAKLITAPKLIAHLKLVAQGVTDSVGMVAASGKLLGETTADLSGFS